MDILRKISNLFHKGNKNHESKITIYNGSDYEICLLAHDDYYNSDINVDIMNILEAIIIKFTAKANSFKDINQLINFKDKCISYGIPLLSYDDDKFTCLFISVNEQQLIRLTTANEENILSISNIYIKYVDKICKNELDIYNHYLQSEEYNNYYENNYCASSFFTYSKNHQPFRKCYIDYCKGIESGELTSTIEIMGYTWIDDDYIPNGINRSSLNILNYIWILINPEFINEFSLVKKYTYEDENIDKIIIKMTIDDFILLLDKNISTLSDDTYDKIYNILKSTSYFDNINTYMETPIEERRKNTNKETLDEYGIYYEGIDEEV